MAAKLKKGDTVVVTTGKDKGKTGEILKVLPSESRVIVKGINIVKRHTKPSQMNAGGIVQKESSIHISNVAIVDPKDKKPARVGFKKLDNGSFARISKRSGEVVDQA